MSFQNIIIKFTQHKSFFWHQNPEIKKLVSPGNFCLHPTAVPAFADYSTNPKKYSGRTLTHVQYTKLHEFSLLNIISYLSEQQLIAKPGSINKKIKRQIFQDNYE